MHNEEGHALYCAIIIVQAIKSRRMRWTGHVAGMREVRDEYGVLVSKPESKRPLESHKRRWEYNIRMDVRKRGWRRGLD